MNHRFALYMDAIEAANDYVLLVADDKPSAWTHRCSQRCDEILLLADAAQPPELHDTEISFLMSRSGRHEAAEFPVLLHDAAKRCPSGTRQWLARRPVTNHFHIRPALERDMARRTRRIELDELPGSWALLRDRFRPRGSRRFRLPSLTAYLMNVTVLYSSRRLRIIHSERESSTGNGLTDGVEHRFSAVRSW